MKFIDFLNTIYTEAAEATTFCEDLGLDSISIMDRLDNTDAETIIAILCAEKKLNLSDIVGRSMEAVEKFSFVNLLDHFNKRKDKED